MPGMRSTVFGRRSAFTLVELLVVIGIIGLLVAILLPVLNKVREQSVATHCANNLRGLGQAWTAYHQANKGTMAPGRMPVRGASGDTYGLGKFMSYRPDWYELCGDAVKRYPDPNPTGEDDDSWVIRDSWFLCAAVSDWINSRNYPFGYNHQFLGNARKRPDGRWINYPVKVNSIKSSQTVVAADSMGTAAGLPKTERKANYNDGTKDRAALGNKGVFIDPPRMTNQADIADPPNTDRRYRSAPDPRHMGLVNVVFGDGHVERLSLQGLGYVVSGNGAVLGTGTGAHNRMFSGSGNDDDPPPAF
jgi:prepilin-type N-terminal cleavage/methylation domain-containing protein/prepilin-type processing-associated H-X9-DG protein